MGLKTAWLLVFAIPALCVASDPAPFASECAELERILHGPVASSSGVSAIVFVEYVALDQPGRAPEVRACALRTLGETGLPEVVEFLAGLKLEDFAGDTTQQIWPAAQTALRDARLRGISDPEAKNRFLEEVLAEPHDAGSNSALNHWAVDQLCDRGAVASLPIIEKSIRSRMNSLRDESEIRFCEERIEVVRRNPDLVKALASVLTVDGPETERLRLWAVYQLMRMHTSEAGAELNRFATEIEKLPPQSSSRQRYESLRTILRDRP